MDFSCYKIQVPAKNEKKPALMRALSTQNPVDVCAQLALAVLLYAVARNTIADRAAKGYATDSSTVAPVVGEAVVSVAGASVAGASVVGVGVGASVAGAGVGATVGAGVGASVGQSSGNGGSSPVCAQASMPVNTPALF